MGFIPITSGVIWVDGVDTRQVPLAILRGAAAVVPQEAVIFVGSVRHNLDPKGELDGSQLRSDWSEAMPEAGQWNPTRGGWYNPLEPEGRIELVCPTIDRQCFGIFDAT
jgi:hypothetical protein